MSASLMMRALLLLIIFCGHLRAQYTLDSWWEEGKNLLFTLINTPTHPLPDTLLNQLEWLSINSDTTKFIGIISLTQPYDATNNIGEDRHNKVNFITDHAFDDPPMYSNFQRIYGIRYKLPDNPSQWYVYRDPPFRQESERTTLLLNDFLPEQPLSEKYNQAREKIWELGYFHLVPDLRLDPNWENYGKQVWKRKEEALRPYIGLPELVRLCLLRDN